MSSSILAATLTCHLCDRHFVAPTADLVVNSVGQGTTLSSFLNLLATHLKERHPQHFKNIELEVMQFMGLRQLMFYKLDNPQSEIAKHRDFLRWTIHQATADAHLTNKAIDEGSRETTEEIINIVSGCDVCGTPSALASYQPVREAIQKLLIRDMQECRKILREPGKYKALLTGANGQPVTG